MSEAEYDDEVTLTKEKLAELSSRIIDNLSTTNILVNSTHHLTHPCDLEDTRTRVAFVGDLSYLASLFSEFWSPKTIQSVSVLTDIGDAALLDDKLSKFRDTVQDYQRRLQQKEVEDYKEKAHGSPFRNLNDDIDNDGDYGDDDEHVDIKGDVRVLPINRLDISTGASFDTILVKGNPEGDHNDHHSHITIEIDRFQPTIIIVVSSSPSSYSHPNIQTIHPQMPTTVTPSDDIDLLFSDDDLEVISTFARGLPDLISMLF